MGLPKSCLNQKFNSHIFIDLSSNKGNIGKVKIEKEKIFFLM